MARQFRPKRKATPPAAPPPAGSGGGSKSGGGSGSGGGLGRHLDKNMVSQFKKAMHDSLGYRRMLGIGLSKEQHAEVRETLTRNWLNEIGYKGTVDAVKNASLRRVEKGLSPLKPPVKSTYIKWVRAGRIPPSKSDVAELVRRRAAIEALGGMDNAAETLGRSKSSIYAWRRGESDSFRGDETNKAVQKQQKLDTAKEMLSKQAAVDPRKPKPKPEPPPDRKPHPWEKDDSWSKSDAVPDEPEEEPERPESPEASAKAKAGAGDGGAGGADQGYPQPRIQIKADVVIYGKGKEYVLYDKELNLTTATWSEEDIEDLILALEDENMEKAIDIIERFATLDWANGTPWDTYDDNNGIHIEDVKSITFWWG